MSEIWSSQLFWLLVIFGLVYIVVGKGMLPRVMDTVGMRDSQIASDLAEAQSARDAANAAEEAWRKRENDNREAAQALVNEAKAAAQKATAAKLAQVQAGIDSQLEAAEARIAASRAEAAAEIESVAAEAAQDITARIANVSVTQDAARAAVQAVVQEAMARG
jgi:F-type H+-transporting ATPase subunit b